MKILWSLLLAVLYIVKSDSTDSIGDTACVDCLVGSFANHTNPNCLACPAGKCVSTKSCTLCSEGTFQNKSASTRCELCPSGQYQEKEGGSSCSPCSAGTQCSHWGCVQCSSCPPGSYANHSGSTGCTLCPVGTSQPDSGSSQCLPCEAGKEARDRGSRKCTDCYAGHYKQHSSTELCLPCPQGQHSSQPGSKLCSYCSQGSYSSNVGSVNCVRCPLGAYCNKTGCTQCQLCAAGASTYQVGSSACVCCGPGEYKPGNGGPCLSCKSGSFTDTFCQTNCSICPLNFYCPCSYCKYHCPQGSYCPAGSTKPKTCSYLMTIKMSNKGKSYCGWTSSLYIIVFGSIIGFLLVLSLIACSIRFKRKQTNQIDQLTGERTPLAAQNKSSKTRNYLTYTGL